MRVTFDPLKFKALALSLSHDELIGLIQKVYPNAVHGQDFVVAHPVAAGSNERTGPAQILAWNLPQEPLDVDKDLTQLWEAHGVQIQTDIAARHARSKRVVLLQQADVLVNIAHDSNDATALAKAVSYRKALRDIPQQPGFPDSITWPTQP